jgi:fructoselysine-6-P-deglycase FrlB-like protein
MALLCSMNTGIPAAAMAAGDILLHSERYGKLFEEAGVVMISRSGRTSELLLALDALDRLGGKIETACMVCADDTPLGAKTGLTLSTPWAYDESVCQTRCVTNFYYMAVYIFARISGNRAVLDELDRIIKDGYGFLEKAEAMAEQLAGLGWNHAVVLADAELEGLAEEGALAFKEICQLPSNYYHLLDVRHGPMVLIGKETLVLAAPGAYKGLEADLITDIKNKGAELVVFTDLEAPTEGLRGIMFGGSLSHAARGIPFILLCQLIAYKKAGVTGANPDKPSGLDAWINL